MSARAAGLRVLVVDDEALVARALQRMLARHGAEVVVAHDGAEGLARVREGQFDAVVSDVRMPTMDGPTMLRALRDAADPTPFVFLTGYNDATDAALIALGADTVLGKPVLTDQLVDAVVACVARARR